MMLPHLNVLVWFAFKPSSFTAESQDLIFSKMNRRIIKLCLFSRIIVSVISIASDTLFPDHNADAYKYEWLTFYQNGFLPFMSIQDHLVMRLTKPFTRWDAQYFLAIAHSKEYLHEQMLAFFPLYPILIRIVSYIVKIIVNIFQIKLNILSIICIASYLINLISFILSALLLFKLTNFLFKKVNASYKIVLYFAFNPASIFFTAFYTESLFCCLTLAGICCLYICKSPFRASLIFALSSATRSNGVISFGYIVYYQLLNFVLQWNSDENKSTIHRILYVLKFILSSIAYAAIILIPFASYQVYAFQKFCQVSQNNSLPEWCSHRLPISYNAVQAKYWNVGFLRYYQLKQIPNFILAAPILAIVIWSSLLYFRKHNLQRVFQDLVTQPSRKILNLLYYNQNYDEDKKNQRDLFLAERSLPFVLHSLFLCLFCLAFMHIQVANRFLLSSNPWPYWAVYHIFHNQSFGSYTRNLVSIWKMSYFVIGTGMFAKFLPFT